MYRGFKISPIGLQNMSLYNAGKNLMTQFNEQVRIELGKYLAPDGSVNGDMIEKEWFPQLKVDVFISHSHDDEHLAVALSAWLYQMFGLIAFVDSGVWGKSDSLLRRIDNEYCMFPDRQQYDYEKRNKSTSYIHMILAMALAKLIDRTECLFFLNTPNATQTSDAIDQPQTHSPWLYYEMGISSLLPKPLSAHRSRTDLIKAKGFSDIQFLNESRSLDLRLPLTVKHLTEIDGDDLLTWRDSYEEKLEGKVHPLDKLYELF